MHKSALQTGKIFFETYWIDEFHNILDIGSRDVNGSLRSVKPGNAAYLGVDMTAGPGVELVLKDPHHLPFDDESFDVIVSTSCLEHDPMFWLSAAEMFRVVKPGGYVYINAPSNGIYHGYPFDHWRFYPDAGKALVQWGERLERPVQLVESFVGRKVEDVWADNVMVFARVPHNGKFPDKLVCDKVAGATNIRRHDTDALEKTEIAPEDLRELQQTRKDFAELKQKLVAAEAQVAALSDHKTRLERQLEALVATTTLASMNRPGFRGGGFVKVLRFPEPQTAFACSNSVQLQQVEYSPLSLTAVCC